MDRPPAVIAFDTNLLIYAHRAGTPEHAAALAALGRARGNARGWGFAFPTLSEFWGVVTSARNPHPSRPEQAAAFLSALVREGGAQVWLPSAELPALLARVAVARGVQGTHILDLQIALIALENGAEEMWTHDAGFVPLPGLRIVDPLGDA